MGFTIESSLMCGIDLSTKSLNFKTVDASIPFRDSVVAHPLQERLPQVVTLTKVKSGDLNKRHYKKDVAMNRMIYSLAMSMDNKIARTDDDVTWMEQIPHPENVDHGFGHYFDAVGTTVMGYKTYQLIRSTNREWPYKGKKSFIVTEQTDVPDDPEVTFITEDHIGFLKELKQKEEKDIWLIGGDKLATSLLNHNLIDRMLLHIMPIFLGEGIPFLEPYTEMADIRLRSCRKNSSGAIELVYDVGPLAEHQAEQEFVA